MTKRKNFSRDPTCTSVINIVCIACAICQFTGFLQCRAIFRPSWLGYWHVLSGLHYCPRLWRCFGQIVNVFISSNGRLNLPTLANINSCSVTFVRERWQLFKWFLTSATHSTRGITSCFPRDSPQMIFPFPMNEHEVGFTALAMASYCLHWQCAVLRCTWSAALKKHLAIFNGWQLARFPSKFETNCPALPSIKQNLVILVFLDQLMAFLGRTRGDTMALLPTLGRSIYDGNMAVSAELHNFQLSRADENWMTAKSFNRIK